MLRLYLYTRWWALPSKSFTQTLWLSVTLTQHIDGLFFPLLNPFKLWTAACMAALELGSIRSIPNVSLNYKLLTNNKSFSLFPCGICSLHHYGDESLSVLASGIRSITAIDWTGEGARPRHGVLSSACLCLCWTGVGFLSTSGKVKWMKYAQKLIFSSEKKKTVLY